MGSGFLGSDTHSVGTYRNRAWGFRLRDFQGLPRVYAGLKRACRDTTPITETQMEKYMEFGSIFG